jgi:hypothetical protein
VAATGAMIRRPGHVVSPRIPLPPARTPSLVKLRISDLLGRYMRRQTNHEDPHGGGG